MKKSDEVFSTFDRDENRGLGLLMAIFPFLFFLTYVIGDKKYSSYCKFRANQSLIVLIVMAALNLAAALIGLALGFIPLIGKVTLIVCRIIRVISVLFYLQNVWNALLCNGKRVFFVGEFDILR